MLDLAVLGAGRIGQIHAANIAAHPGACLVGIADTDAAAADRLATALGTRTLSVDEAMRADAILVASPTPTHADYVQQAAAAGHAVFCEKPIDLSVDRVPSCLAAGFQSDPVLPFFLERYAAAYRAELAAFVKAIRAGLSRSPAAPLPSIPGIPVMRRRSDAVRVVTGHL
jgi:myo-inositol 2-dehydrogenase / D-chiro-inositol 1-dehydrogenase